MIGGMFHPKETNKNEANDTMTAVKMSVHINKTKRNQYINILQKQLIHPVH